jgi:hypothetical protein
MNRRDAIRALCMIVVPARALAAQASVSTLIGNHRIRAVEFASGTIATFAGTGQPRPTPGGTSVVGAPLNGPRTMAFDRKDKLYLSLREGTAIYRINTKTAAMHHVAGTGEPGYAGDGGTSAPGETRRPKGARRLSLVA